MQEHPTLTKDDRKSLCGLMDVKKLTTDASMHAAQNERLPLRVVVQILYFEQVRAAGVQAVDNSSNDALDSTRNTEEDWQRMWLENGKSLARPLSQMKIKGEDVPKPGKLAKKGSKSRGSGAQLLPSRSRRIFDKLWVVGKVNGNAENRSSETSASSQSPKSFIQGEIKSSVPFSRHRRHSIS